MNALSPKRKLLLAALLLALAGACSAGSTVGVVAAARWVLAAGCVGGMGWWWARSRASAGGPQLEPRLLVTARAGLSPRCAVALVEADGHSYLVAYGDGFATIQEQVSRRPRAQPVAQARRPRPPSRKPRVLR